MFSRAGAYEASIAFHQLAQLRPELVIPPILERLYSALDTVTEPHRLTATLQCLVSVIRPLVRGKAYPEGPSHVLPLLMACLPAIDPNDIRKTLVCRLFLSLWRFLFKTMDFFSLICIGHISVGHFHCNLSAFRRLLWCHIAAFRFDRRRGKSLFCDCRI